MDLMYRDYSQAIYTMCIDPKIDTKTIGEYALSHFNTHIRHAPNRSNDIDVPAVCIDDCIDDIATLAHDVRTARPAYYTHQLKGLYKYAGAVLKRAVNGDD